MKTYQEQGSDYIRAAIGGAIFSLLEGKNYEDIKVIDIYKNASVGKTTYYRYFGNKDGKKDAMYFHLKENFNKYKCTHSEVEWIDDQFGNYIWEEKDKIKLLKRENCLDVMDRLILSIYGPEKNDKDTLYLKYMGAGLWMGLLRAVIENDFNDEPSSIREKLSFAFVEMIQKQNE